MNTFSIAEAVAPAYSHAFGRTLSIEELRHRTPAVFAGNASERTKPTYRFINTAGVLEALLDAGFVPSAAQQTRSRKGFGSELRAAHDPAAAGSGNRRPGGLHPGDLPDQCPRWDQCLPAAGRALPAPVH